MSVIKELIRSEKDGSLSFGNYELKEKSKVNDFNHSGDLYKVKTFYEITKLEENDSFVYESVPGTAVHEFSLTNDGATFTVEGKEDAQITLGLEEDSEYEVYIDGKSIGGMTTNMSGKLVLGVELGADTAVSVKISKK